MGIESFGKWRKPSNPKAKLAYEQLLYAERNGHDIEPARRELSELGSRGRPKAAATRETTTGETPERARLRMLIEAHHISLERNDHLLPSEDDEERDVD